MKKSLSFFLLLPVLANAELVRINQPNISAGIYVDTNTIKRDRALFIAPSDRYIFAWKYQADSSRRNRIRQLESIIGRMSGGRFIPVNSDTMVQPWDIVKNGSTGSLYWKTICIKRSL